MFRTLPPTRHNKGRSRDVLGTSPGRRLDVAGRPRDVAGRRRVAEASPERSLDVAGTSPRRAPADVPGTSPGRPRRRIYFSAPESVTNNRFAINTVVSFAIFGVSYTPPHAV